MNSEREKMVKKAYQSPKVVAYGDIRDLTQTTDSPSQQSDRRDPSGIPTGVKTGYGR